MLFGKNNIIRCMTFNIHYDNPKDKNNMWKHRKEMVASAIRFHHADVAGLQEVLKNQLDDLTKLLPSYAWVGVGREDGVDKGEFTPIFYLKERFELLSSGTFWLSKTPDELGSRGWDAACKRIVTWAEFKDKVLELKFYHFNTHFDHIGFNARHKSAYLLLQKIQEKCSSFPVIVTGDFNCNEKSKTYKILTGYGNKDLEYRSLRDARLESFYDHHGPTITYHNYKAIGLFKLMRKFRRFKNVLNKFNIELNMDFVFIKNNFKVQQYGILSDIWDGWYPSDHMPVVADLVLCN